MLQKTVSSPVSLSGVGLHNGTPTQVRILPAPIGSGVQFHRVDLAPSVRIPANSMYVRDTTLATVLGREGATISTVEHCLAALAGLQIDNVVVEVDGAELPILDGSALPYVEALLDAGWRLQNAPRPMMRVEKPLRVADGEKFCILRPADGFRVTYAIDFDGRFPGAQDCYIDLSPESFAAEISPARTFGFLSDVEFLRSVGKAKGGSLENAVVLHEGKVLNPEGLRMPDELVRHKILDLVGDLSLAGFPIQGHLIVHKGGHALHDLLVKELLARPDAWSVVEPIRPQGQCDRGEVRPHPLVAAHV